MTTRYEPQVGDRVVVRCTDGKLDPGTVLSVYRDGGPHVKFDDGTYCTVPNNRVFPEFDPLTEVIEAAVNAGFDPADESPLEWISDRYEGYRTDPLGWVCFNTRDGEINLYYLTTNGLLNAEANFTLNRLGLAMFVAAATIKMEAP